MFSSLSRLPASYLIAIGIALFGLGWVVNLLKPAPETHPIGLVVVGICQIMIGLGILMLIYAFVRKRWS